MRASLARSAWTRGSGGRARKAWAAKSEGEAAGGRHGGGGGGVSLTPGAGSAAPFGHGTRALRSLGPGSFFAALTILMPCAERSLCRLPVASSLSDRSSSKLGLNSICESFDPRRRYAVSAVWERAARSKNEGPGKREVVEMEKVREKRRMVAFGAAIGMKRKR